VRLTSEDARALFAAARVARLATVGADGRPHLVPIVFAVDGDTVHTAVDAKPKRTAALQRLANIAAQPAVSLLADHYEDDWSRLWWVRADGAATVRGHDERALALLAARYPQYRPEPPDGPFISIAIERWTGWASAPDLGGGLDDQR
jgi:PPOX class probable F420-dependent enzyme